MPKFIKTIAIYTAATKKHRDDIDLTTLVAEAVKGKNYANDAAAATAGVKVGELYHTAGAVKVRLV